MDLEDRFDVFNLCSGVQTSINYLAKLFGHPVSYQKMRRFEERHKQGSFQKACEAFGWRPQVSIEEGVGRFKQDQHIMVRSFV